MKLSDYKNIAYQNLSDTPTVLIQSNGDTLYINSITICNLSTTDSITVSLQLHQTFASPTVLNTYLIKDIIVPPSKSESTSGSIDLVSVLGHGIYLTQSDSTTDGLICFSGGYTEQFDCVVNYTQLLR